MPEWVWVGGFVVLGMVLFGVGWLFHAVSQLSRAVKQLQRKLIEEGRLRKRKWSDDA